MAENNYNPTGLFPEPFASNTEKDSDAYALAIGKLIDYEWFYNDNGYEDDNYYNRRVKFERFEKLRDNNPDLTPFKDQFGMGTDKAWAAIDWRFTPIIPKFIDTIVDGFNLDLYKVQAEGIDEVSQAERYDYKENIKTEMLTKDYTKLFSQATGIDYTYKGELPESMEELDLLMMTDYKQQREIAAELLIENTLKINKFGETFNRIIQDIVVYGTGATRNEIDADLGIVQRYVNPKHFIYSRDFGFQRDKRDCYYFGEIKIMKIEEVAKAAPGKFTEEQLKQMATSYGSKYGNDLSRMEDDYLQFNVEVVKYAFKTVNYEVYKQKYKGNIVKKKDDWELHPDSKSKRIEGIYDVWYEGNYIAGTQYVYGHKKMTNMIRPNSDVNKVLSPYSCYVLNTPCMVERMESYANDIHIAVLKLRQLIITAKPQGVMIDIDALTEVDMGSGGILDPIKIIEIYNQRGDVLFSSKSYDGERIVGNPVQPIPNGIGADLQQLINTYNHNLQMLYNVTGINAIRDGSSQDADMLVGTQKIALAQSNTATRHILNGALSILSNLSEVIISRAQQMNMYGERYSKRIENALGRDNVAVVKEAYELHEHQFLFEIEVEPDIEERAEFERWMELAINRGDIDPTDAIEIKGNKNLKLATQQLRMRIEKNKKKRRQEELEKIKVQEDARAQSTIAINNSENGKLQMQIQAEQAKSQFEAMKDVKIITTQSEIDVMIENLKHQHAMELEEMKARILQGANQFKEDRKDKRTEMQAGQSSKMIDQRTTDSAPIDFETEGEVKRSIDQQMQQ